MFGRQKSKWKGLRSASDRQITVDLGEYDIKNDISQLKIKVIDVNDSSDMEKVTPFIGHGDILFIDMSSFSGSDTEIGYFVESMRSQAHVTGYKLYPVGNGYYIASPEKAVIKRL